MDNIEMLMWMVGAGFTISFAILLVIYKELKETRVHMHDIDKRVYGIETLLHMKDCCVLKSDQQLKKAE